MADQVRRLMTVCEIWVAVSIALAFAWKLRWAVIRPDQFLGDIDIRTFERARQQRTVLAACRCAIARLHRKCPCSPNWPSRPA